MFLKFLFYAFLIYLAWKLIFDLVIPVVRTTRQVKRGFREMREKMEQHQFTGQGPTPQPQTKKNDISGDYIEYEEVKD